MIAIYKATVNGDPTAPVVVLLPTGAQALDFSMDMGFGTVTLLTDDSIVTTEPRTFLFAYESIVDNMVPAPALDVVIVSKYTYLGSSRGIHCWIS